MYLGLPRKGCMHDPCFNDEVMVVYNPRVILYKICLQVVDVRKFIFVPECSNILC